MNEQTVSIRTALMPLCYKDFHCLAGDCRDNCCGGWEIAFNKKDYLHIKRSAKSQELREILSEGMSRLRGDAHDELYARFDMDAGGQCRFQTAEGLCRLQMECGAETLPHVCRVYPRQEWDTPAGRELSLSPSCEAVLALLWDLPQGIDFWEEPLPKRDWKNVEVYPRWRRFAEIRSFCIDVLQERTLPLAHRLLLLGLLLQRLKGTEWAEPGVVDEWLAWGESQLRSPATAAALGQLPKNRESFLSSNFQMLMELYKAHAAGTAVYQELFSAFTAGAVRADPGMASVDLLRYQALEGQLEELLGHTEHFFENLMVMTAFYLSFPDVDNPGDLWKSYVDLCCMYSFCRFAAVYGCAQESSRERLFHVLGTVNRGLLHDSRTRRRLLDELIEGNSASLAHMAILLGG